jgi:hypothetical protein
MSDGLMQEEQELNHAAGRAAGGAESQMFWQALLQNNW